MPTATDRFMDALCSHLRMTDEDRVRLEDAFTDAVEERVERALREGRRDREY